MELPHLRSQMPLQICGDFLATFFDSRHLIEVEIVVWNWKTGEVVTVSYFIGVTFPYLIIGLVEYRKRRYSSYDVLE